MQNVQRHFRTHTCKEIAKDIPSSLLSLGSENMKKVYMFDHMFGGFFFFFEGEWEREIWSSRFEGLKQRGCPNFFWTWLFLTENVTCVLAYWTPEREF